MNSNLKQQSQATLNAYNEKDYVSIVRALAIFSVVCAHVTDGSGSITNLVISSLGTYGVAVFFLLSGYVFSFEKRSFGAFCRRKLTTILIPWLFCGTLDWLYVVLRKGGITFSGWVSSIFVLSHYYYLTVLILCYVIMWRIRGNRKMRFCLFFISALSVWLTGKGLLDVYPYSNVFNWIGYFLVGIEIAERSSLESVSEVLEKQTPWLMVLCVFAVAWEIYDRYAVSYWYHGTILAIIPMVLLSFGIARKLQSIRESRFRSTLIGIGKVSFTIYLIHMPFAGVLKFFVDRTGMVYLRFLLPFAVLTIVSGIIFCIQVLPLKQSLKRMINVVMGIRE